MSNLLAPFQLLELNVLSAQDLAPVSRSMRTYAVAWVHPDRKLSTRVDAQGHNNPKWNDKFVFRVDEEFLHDEASIIMIDVYALHWYKDIHVGTVSTRISNLVHPPSAKGFHSNRPPAGMKFVALQVRRPSGRPQGILNVGANFLDSSMRSLPLHKHENGPPDRYNDNVMEDDGEEDYEHDHDHRPSRYHFQKQELRRAKSDSSSTVNSELAQPKVVNRRGEISCLSSASELSLKQNQNEYSMASNPMVSGRSKGINRVNENYGHEYVSDDAIDSDGDDRVAVGNDYGDESEVTEHRGMSMESEVMDPPIHKKTESFIDSSEEENEIAAAIIDEERRHNMHEKKVSMGTISGSTGRGTPRGTPLHPMASASPQHRMSATPQHGKMGTPQHPMSFTPRHRLAGMSQRTVSSSPRHPMTATLTPQHTLSHTPRHDKAGIFGRPQREMASMFASPRHEKALTPRHEKFGTPLHEKFGTTHRHELTGTPGGTPRHEMAGPSRHEKLGGTPRHEKLIGTPRHEMTGTPRHEKFGGSPRHEMAGTPQHEKFFGTPRHEMAGTPRHDKLGGTSRHELVGTPRHEKLGGTPRHEIVGTPRHEMAGSPRHGMAGTPRHAMEGTPSHHRLNSGTPLHPMSRTPLRKSSGSNEMIGKPGTSLHGMSFTKFVEFESPRKSKFMGSGTTMTDSELGPSPSEVAADLSKPPRDHDHDNYVVGGWSMDDSTVEGLQSKLERWKTELPPVYDNCDIPSSVSNTTTSRSAGKRTGRKKSSGLFSCFSNICGLQCTIAFGSSDAKKKGKKGKGAATASSEVTSYL